MKIDKRNLLLFFARIFFFSSSALDSMKYFPAICLCLSLLFFFTKFVPLFGSTVVLFFLFFVFFYLTPHRENFGIFHPLPIYLFLFSFNFEIKSFLFRSRSRFLRFGIGWQPPPTACPRGVRVRLGLGAGHALIWQIWLAEYICCVKSPPLP